MGMPYYLLSEKIGEIVSIDPAFNLTGLRVELFDGKSWQPLSGYDSASIKVEISEDGVSFNGSTINKGSINSLNIGGYLFKYIRVTAADLQINNIRICFSISFVDSINKDVDEFARFIKKISASPATLANLGSAQSVGVDASRVIADIPTRPVVVSDGESFSKIGDKSGLSLAIRCAAIGDSRFANSIQDQSTQTVRKKHWANQGSLFWLNFLTYQMLDFPIDNDLAVSGATTSQIAAQVNNVLTLNPLPAICFINGGTNSFGLTPTSAQVTQSLADIIGAAKTLQSFGITPVIETDTPRTVASWSAAAQKCSISYNNQLRVACQNNNIRLADHEAAYLQISGEPASGYNVADGIHQSCTGAVVRALALKTAIADIISALQQPTTHPLDIYDSTYNAYGNLLTNPLMSGTSGLNAGTGASGSVPTSWTNQVVSGTMTAVASKESPRADGILGDALQIIMSATTAAMHRISPSISVSVPSGVVAGDKVIGEIDLEIGVITGGVDYLRLNVFDFDGVTQASTSVAGKDVFTTGLNPLPVVPLLNNTGAKTLATSLKGRLKTAEIIMGQGITSTTIMYRLETGLTAGAAITYKVGGAKLRKV